MNSLPCRKMPALAFTEQTPYCAYPKAGLFDFGLRRERGTPFPLRILVDVEWAVIKTTTASIMPIGGGKDRLGSISKQGDRYLRSLFVAGALAVIRYAKVHGTSISAASDLLGVTNSARRYAGGIDDMANR
jgi:hypothetical protein